ncbi:hypothetical protein, conserved [Plasmodium ovale]|uniref:STP1 protein n=1 Tax=Plasmodium ovale TaxID=36330 RepID=A0A1C3KIK7_PLAOA|nr:hypothetical protein, conserved [Plasmodium ovale]
MAGDSGYATNLRDIPVSFFKAMLVSDIKKLIHTYGHKNCGLRQEELCNKIKEIISQKKNIIFEHMDTASKKKWSDEWNSERSKYFDKLYKEEGFINMCFPKKYTNNPSLNKLMSKHIDFCKEKDERRSALGNNPEYNVCKQYNIWINEKTVSFTLEFLKNVTAHKYPTVKKYFSTKEHPEGYDPLTTYRNSKFDCEKYNPTSKSYQPIQVTKAPTDRSNLPTAPTDRQESQGKSGIPVPDEGEIEKTKSHVKELSKIEPPPDSLTSSINKTKEDGSAIGKEPRTSPENEPTKTKNTDHSNSGHNDDEQIRNDVLLTGKPVSETPPVSESSPVPELISVSKNSPDYNDPKYHQFLHHLRSNLDGYKIPFHDYHIIHKIPVKLFQSYKTYEEHIPSEPTITKPYIWYPAPLPRSRSYPDPFPRQTMYPVASFFPTKLSPFPIITSGSNNKYYYQFIYELNYINILLF